jgi:hypothetical protein
MTKYPSKISWWLVGIITVVFGGSTLLALSGGAWQILFINLPVLAFITHMFSTTYYIIDGDRLMVHCGFYKKEFDIKSFRKIEETNNPISSPALSFDRLELYFEGYNSIVISPRDKMGFIAQIQQVHPDIVFQPKQ